MKIKFEAELDILKLQKYIEKALHEHKLENGLTIAECVERQIPKKPMRIERITFNDVYECPCCKKTVYRNIYSKILLSLRTSFRLELIK